MDVLCFSGGLDSFIASEYIPSAKLVYFNIGHRYAEKELLAIRYLDSKRSMTGMVIDKRLFMGDVEKPNSEIPMRNMLFASLATLYGDRIWMVFQKGETSNESHDRSPEFCSETSKLLSLLHGREIIVDSPFWDFTKQDMVEWYIQKGLDPELLKSTVSCYSPKTDSTHTHCGECSSCLRKAIALEYNNIDTSGMFIFDIKKYPGIPEYIQKMNAGKYEERRAEQSLEVFKRWGWKV